MWNHKKQDSFNKVLFTNHCRWQNFHPSLLCLVNHCVESIYKTQKTRTKVCHLQRSVNSTLKLGLFEFLKASNPFFQLYTATDADGNRGKCGFTITVLVNSAGRASSNKPELPPPLGPFTNWVDKFLDLFDHLPPSVDIFYLINVDKKSIFFRLL